LRQPPPRFLPPSPRAEAAAFADADLFLCRDAPRLIAFFALDASALSRQPSRRASRFAAEISPAELIDTPLRQLIADG